MSFFPSCVCELTAFNVIRGGGGNNNGQDNFWRGGRRALSALPAPPEGEEVAAISWQRRCAALRPRHAYDVGVQVGADLYASQCSHRPFRCFHLEEVVSRACQTDSSTPCDVVVRGVRCRGDMAYSSFLARITLLQDYLTAYLLSIDDAWCRPVFSRFLKRVVAVEIPGQELLDAIQGDNAQCAAYLAEAYSSLDIGAEFSKLGAGPKWRPKVTFALSCSGKTTHVKNHGGVDVDLIPSIRDIYKRAGEVHGEFWYRQYSLCAEVDHAVHEYLLTHPVHDSYNVPPNDSDQFSRYLEVYDCNFVLIPWPRHREQIIARGRDLVSYEAEHRRFEEKLQRLGLKHRCWFHDQHEGCGAPELHANPVQLNGTHGEATNEDDRVPYSVWASSVAALVGDVSEEDEDRTGVLNLWTMSGLFLMEHQFPIGQMSDVQRDARVRAVIEHQENYGLPLGRGVGREQVAEQGPSISVTWFSSVTLRWEITMFRLARLEYFVATQSEPGRRGISRYNVQVYTDDHGSLFVTSANVRQRGRSHAGVVYAEPFVGWLDPLVGSQLNGANGEYTGLDDMSAQPTYTRADAAAPCEESRARPPQRGRGRPREGTAERGRGHDRGHAPGRRARQARPHPSTNAQPCPSVDPRRARQELRDALYGLLQQNPAPDPFTLDRANLLDVWLDTLKQLRVVNLHGKPGPTLAILNSRHVQFGPSGSRVVGDNGPVVITFLPVNPAKPPLASYLIHDGEPMAWAYSQRIWASIADPKVEFAWGLCSGQGDRTGEVPASPEEGGEGGADEVGEQEWGDLEFPNSDDELWAARETMPGVTYTYTSVSMTLSLATTSAAGLWVVASTSLVAPAATALPSHTINAWHTGNLGSTTSVSTPLVVLANSTNSTPICVSDPRRHLRRLGLTLVRYAFYFVASLGVRYALAWWMKPTVEIVPTLLSWSSCHDCGAVCATARMGHASQRLWATNQPTPAYAELLRSNGIVSWPVMTADALCCMRPAPWWKSAVSWVWRCAVVLKWLVSRVTLLRARRILGQWVLMPYVHWTGPMIIEQPAPREALDTYQRKDVAAYIDDKNRTKGQCLVAMYSKRLQSAVWREGGFIYTDARLTDQGASLPVIPDWDLTEGEWCGYRVVRNADFQLVQATTSWRNYPLIRPSSLLPVTGRGSTLLTIKQCAAAVMSAMHGSEAGHTTAMRIVEAYLAKDAQNDDTLAAHQRFQEYLNILRAMQTRRATWPMLSGVPKVVSLLALICPSVDEWNRLSHEQFPLLASDLWLMLMRKSIGLQNYASVKAVLVWVSSIPVVASSPASRVLREACWATIRWLGISSSAIMPGQRDSATWAAGWWDQLASTQL